MINYPNTTVDHCCFDKPLVLMSCQAAKLFDGLLLPKCRIQIPKIAYLPPRWLPPAKSEKRHFFGPSTGSEWDLNKEKRKEKRKNTHVTENKSSLTDKRHITVRKHG